MCPTMAKAAIAAGADSLMIEVHPNPAEPLSDGPQSLTLDQFDHLMEQLTKLGQVEGRWPQPESRPIPEPALVRVR